jgi:hypothetical protein
MEACDIDGSSKSGDAAWLGSAGIRPITTDNKKGRRLSLTA